MHEPPAQSPLHEGSNISLRGLIKFGIWFVTAGAVINLIIWSIFVFFRSNENRREDPITGLIAQHVQPPEPRLQPSIAHNALPAQDLKAMREREHAEFVRRGWIDEQTGTIRVPAQIAAQIAQLSQPRPATQPAEKVR
jgi:hypothetical protein